MSKMLSVSMVAVRLGVSETYIRRLLKSGKLKGQQVGKTWVISQHELDNFSLPKNKKGCSDRKRNFLPPKGVLKCLSFFSGAMGLDIGLEQMGICTLLASEIDKACRETISINKPDIGLIGDIRNYSAQQIRYYAGLSENEDIDIIAGGPPCQAFSTAGRRKGFEDDRGNVFLHFIDLILELNPRFVIIENVRGLLSAPLKHRPHSQRGMNHPPLSNQEIKGGALLYILEKLQASGYEVSFNLYNAANFGAPQIRERVVLLCSRGGKKIPYLVPTHSENGLNSLSSWKTLRQALDGLANKPQNFIKFPEKRLFYYRMLKSGQNWRNLPDHLQREALGNSYHAGGGKTGFLRRLAWDKPAPTLVTHPAMPATDLAHPEENRPLSVQEYKRIQEFPDEWIFGGNIIDQYKQIGNAVPISLGRAIGKAVIDYINNINNEVISDFSYSRYSNTDDVNWKKSILNEYKKFEQLMLI